MHDAISEVGRWCLLHLVCLSVCIASEALIVADFEGAHIGVVTRVADNHFSCALPGQADQDGRNRQVSWYYFRLDNARGQNITITLTGLRNEYNYKRGGISISDETPPMVSNDGKNWHHLQEMVHDPIAETSTFQVTPTVDRLWIAHIEPYTYSQLKEFLLLVLQHPHVQHQVIGQSVGGRDVSVLTIADPTAVATNKPVIWLMFRQHAWETGTSFVAEGVINYLLSAEATELRKKIIVKLFPMVDPDGCALGGIRFNRHGYDVNRNWDSCDPDNPQHLRLMPEIAACKFYLEQWLKQGKRMDVFVTLHNQERGGWLSEANSAKVLSRVLCTRLNNNTSCFLSDAEPRINTLRPDPGRMAVYQFLDIVHQQPAMLLEQGVAFDKKLQRLPVANDRRIFGREFIQVLAELVQDKP